MLLLTNSRKPWVKAHPSSKVPDSAAGHNQVFREEAAISVAAALAEEEEAREMPARRGSMKTVKEEEVVVAMASA